MDGTIIGMTGSFGSGCSLLSEKFFVAKHGFRHIALSSILKKIYSELHDGSQATRSQLQDFGNEIRAEHGLSYLADKAIAEIEQVDPDHKGLWLIDSIRNPGEVNALRNHFARFYLVAVNADKDIRWGRVSTKEYHDDRRLFEADDKRDSEEKEPTGQRVRECYDQADFIIINNEEIMGKNEFYQIMDKKIERFLNFVQKNVFEPDEQETLMAMAYANSFRSSCLKRKVGALIVTNDGQIFSSGFNEVPNSGKRCIEAYGQCYRDHLRNKFREDINQIIAEAETQDKVYSVFKSNIKMLDYCKALHAEENAILNVARFGSSAALKDSKLYTTTYPCSLCANKIAQLGISEVIYLEPYPLEEAKNTLKRKKVTQTPFEGVTYKGYFRT